VETGDGEELSAESANGETPLSRCEPAKTNRPAERITTSRIIVRPAETNPVSRKNVHLAAVLTTCNHRKIVSHKTTYLPAKKLEETNIQQQASP
ncbi:hypothetical protein Tco_0515901, partial [Tanacetum coccineum]